MIDLTKTAEELGRELLPQHKIWADTYALTKNKRRASEAAGASPNTLDQYGYVVYRRPDVKAYLDACFRESTMSAREVLERLNEVATLDISLVCTLTESGILMIDGKKIIEMGYGRYLKSAGFDSNGNPKYEFLDPQAALLAIGRAHKLFGDSNTLSGPDGGAVPMEMRIVFVDAPAGQQGGSESSPDLPAPKGSGDVEITPEN